MSFAERASASAGLTEPAAWSESRFHYPIFLNSTEPSSETVGQSFYLLGADAAGNVWRSQVFICSTIS